MGFSDKENIVLGEADMTKRKKWKIYLWSNGF